MRRRFIGGAVVVVLVLASVLALAVGLVVAFVGDGDGGGGGGSGGALVVVVLVLGLLVRLTVRWARPTARVIGAADRVAAGDLSARADVRRGPRTIRRLGRSFDAMAEQLAAEDARRRQLLADVAHELRTPLTVVRGNVEGMADGVYAPDAERLRRVVDEVERAERLLEDLRTLSDADAGALRLDREAVALDRLVERVVTRYEPRAAARGVALVTTVAARPVVDADPGRLEQVLTNLLDNALRHGEGATRVELVVGHRRGARDADGTRGEGMRADGDGADGMPGGDRGVGDGEAWATLAVTDDGPGIAPDLVDHVFDRYVTTSDRGGSGLGLPIVKRVVEQHGGRVAITSEAGRTTVRVELPLA